MAATWTRVDAISVTSVQVGSESRPTTADDGFPLENIHGITVYLDAGAGQTITSDAGQADFYLYESGVWAIAPLAPMAVPPHAAGERRVSLGTIPMDNPRGRMAVILSGVTLSGATATLDILVTIDRRGIAKAA